MIKQSNIAHLNLSDNDFGDEGICIIANNLCDTIITDLYLQGCGATTEGIIEITKRLIDSKIINFICAHRECEYDIEEKDNCAAQLEQYFEDNYAILQYEPSNEKIQMYLRRNAHIMANSRFRKTKDCSGGHISC